MFAVIKTNYYHTNNFFCVIKGILPWIFFDWTKKRDSTGRALQLLKLKIGDLTIR